MAYSFQKSPVIADILSRLTSVESAQGALPTPTEYDTVSDLRAETVYSNTDRALVSSPINGSVYIYVFNESVSEPDNGETILTPDDITEPAAGRWVADVSLSIVGHTHKDKADRITEPQQGKFLESDENGDPVESEHGAGDFSLKSHGHENYLDGTDKEELEQAVEGAVNAVENKMDKLTGITSGHIGSIPFIREDGGLDPSTIKATNIPSPDEKAGIVGLTGTDPAAKLSHVNAILALLSSDDTTLDELQEIVDYIKLNRDDLNALSVSSIIGLQEALNLKLTDAPENNYSYVRFNGGWVKEGSVVWENTASLSNIYVETTGNDETGNGMSVGTAYATISRALEDVAIVLHGTVNINLGLGRFAITPEDVLKLNSLETIRLGKVVIKGTWVTISKGFSITANSVQEGEHGITGTTFMASEHKGRFLYNSSQWKVTPIADNTETSIICRDSYMNTTISELGTTLDISGVLIFTTKIPVSFTYVKFNLTNNIRVEAGNIFIAVCSFIGSSVFLVYGGTVGIRCSYFESSSSIRPLAFQSLVTNVEEKECILEGCVFSGASPTGIVSSGNINFLITEGTMFYGLTNCLSIDSGYFFLKAEGKLYVCSCTNLIENASDNFNIHIENVIPMNGTVLELLSNSPKGYNTTLVVKGLGGDGRVRVLASDYYNPQKNKNIYIKGVTFPEEEYNLSSPLTNNVRNNITVANTAQNRAAIIDYTIERNRLYEQGQIRILYDGTTLQFLQPSGLKQDNNLGSGIGVTFDADFDMADTNLINLLITLDNGDDATVKYNVKRSML